MRRRGGRLQGDLGRGADASVRAAEGRGLGSCSELGVLCERELLTSDTVRVP